MSQFVIIKHGIEGTDTFLSFHGVCYIVKKGKVSGTVSSARVVYCFERTAVGVIDVCRGDELSSSPVLIIVALGREEMIFQNSSVAIL